MAETKPARKAAPKKTAEAAPAATKTRKPRAVSAKQYGIAINDGPISGPFASVDAALSEASLTVTSTDTVTTYRAIKTGKIKTKIRIG